MSLGSRARLEGQALRFATLSVADLEDGWPDTPRHGHGAAQGVGWSLFRWTSEPAGLLIVALAIPV